MRNVNPENSSGKLVKKKVYIFHIWIKDHAYFSYTPLYDKLRDDYNGVNFSEGLWFLYTDKTAQEISDSVKDLVFDDHILKGQGTSQHDIYFVCEAGKDYSGYFFVSGYEWLQEHINNE